MTNSVSDWLNNLHPSLRPLWDLENEVRKAAQNAIVLRNDEAQKHLDEARRHYKDALAAIRGGAVGTQKASVRRAHGPNTRAGVPSRNVELDLVEPYRCSPVDGKGPRKGAVNTNQVGEAKKQQTAITQAFEGACEELGFGLGSLDVWKREQLAHLILQLVSEGELESTTLQRCAASHFKHADADHSSTALC